MESGNNSLVEEIIHLKVRERVNQAIIDTILDNTTLNRNDDKPYFTDKGMRELYTIIERFYSDEFNNYINAIRKKAEEEEEKYKNG